MRQAGALLFVLIIGIVYGVEPGRAVAMEKLATESGAPLGSVVIHVANPSHDIDVRPLIPPYGATHVKVRLNELAVRRVSCTKREGVYRVVSSLPLIGPTHRQPIYVPKHHTVTFEYDCSYAARVGHVELARYRPVVDKAAVNNNVSDVKTGAVHSDASVGGLLALRPGSVRGELGGPGGGIGRLPRGLVGLDEKVYLKKARCTPGQL